MASEDGAEELGGRPRVLFRRVQLERVDGETRLSVLCARRLQAVEVSECRNCPHCRGLCISEDSRELFLRCAARPDSAPMQREVSLQVAAVADIASVPALAVERDDDLHTVLDLFERHGFSAAPVNDERGRAVGIVTKTDVIRHFQELEERAATSAAIVVDREHVTRVREVMSHVVFTLPADAAITGAAALMAYEGVHHLVITDPDGSTRGIVSSLDVLRWLARNSGYVVPG